MVNATKKPGKLSKSIIMLVLALILSALLPGLTANAATVKATTTKWKYTIEDAIRGIDVSKWQGKINWNSVAEDDVAFALCRATYGAEADTTFVTNAKGAYEAGLDVGAYHFARFKDSASVKSEAAAFIKQLSKVTLTYPAVLDIENHFNLSKKTLTNLVLQFISIMEDAGYKTMVYTYQNFYTGRLDLSKLEDQTLWVANYVEKPKAIDHVMWQFSNRGKVKGISGNVDLNVAYEDLSTKRTKSKRSTTDVVFEFLNEHYGVALDSNSFNQDEVDSHIARAFQTEVNKQLDGGVEVDGRLDDSELTQLADIDYVFNQTKGRITSLVQSRMYFAGYIEHVNGVYDSDMVTALKSMQRDRGLEPHGRMDRNTWMEILYT